MLAQNENIYGLLPCRRVSIAAILRWYRSAAPAPMATRWPMLAGRYPVIVPPTPGVLSALGFLYSDVKNEFAQTYSLCAPSTTPTGAQIGDILTKLGRDARAWQREEGIEELRQRRNLRGRCPLGMGHLGQALSDHPPPLQCRCHSRARASLRNRHQGPSIMGSWEPGGTIYSAALPL